MITYLYWALVIVLSFGTFLLLSKQTKNWKVAGVAGLILLGAGSLLYYFNLQQVFVKHWGGTMHISVPKGQLHMQATWKEDNLWIENYNPKNNTCVFNEYSKGNLLEGKVIIKDCNPLRKVQP